MMLFKIMVIVTAVIMLIFLGLLGWFLREALPLLWDMVRGHYVRWRNARRRHAVRNYAVGRADAIHLEAHR